MLKNRRIILVVGLAVQAGLSVFPPMVSPVRFNEDYTGYLERHTLLWEEVYPRVWQIDLARYVVYTTLLWTFVGGLLLLRREGK